MSYSRDFLLSLSQYQSSLASSETPSSYLDIRSNIYNSNRLNKNINKYSKSFKNNCRSSQKKEEKSERVVERKGILQEKLPQS